jgi:DeoR/GlpR family transcriptional regulator of sugar metabolism
MLATFKRSPQCTVGQLAHETNSSEATIREWLYELQRFKLAHPVGIKHRKSGPGIQPTLWELTLTELPIPDRGGLAPRLLRHLLAHNVVQVQDICEAFNCTEQRLHMTLHWLRARQAVNVRVVNKAVHFTPEQQSCPNAQPAATSASTQRAATPAATALPK